MANIADLETLRPLGKLEQVSASCHHLGFFNNVGVSVHYTLSEGCLPVGFNLRRVIYTAVGDVLRSHRILFAVPVNEDSPGPYFASLPSIDLDRSIRFLRRSQPSPGNSEGEDKELDAILEDQHNTNFKTDYGALPFWRLVILRTPESEAEAEVDTEFTASFIYHHAIGDGVSGTVFHNAFRSALLAALSSFSSSSEIQRSVEPRKTTLLLPPVEELHPEPIHPNPPGPGITANLKEWTGNSIHTPCQSRWASLHISPAVSDAFFLECKENNASVTSALSSVIASVLFNTLPPTEEVLTCIIPISLRPWLNLPRDVANGAIGTYFDATRVRLARADGYAQDDGATDIWPGARNVSKVIKDYLCNVSPSGEPYTAIAVLKGIPDFSVICKAMLGGPRDAAFEVTNIGLFPSLTKPESENSHLCRVGRVTLSRSALASGAAITASIATGGNGAMTVGFSWQDGVVEDDVIHAVCKGVRRYFEKYS